MKVRSMQFTKQYPHSNSSPAPPLSSSDSYDDSGARCLVHDIRGHDRLRCSKQGNCRQSGRLPGRILRRRRLGGMLHRTHFRLLSRSRGLLLRGDSLLPALIPDRKPGLQLKMGLVEERKVRLHCAPILWKRAINGMFHRIHNTTRRDV